jgi:choline-sulfatase
MNRPDILIFMSDQHNALLCGPGGDTVVRTPHMDKLAADGTAFDAAYTSFPLCVPARIGFMTGQLSHRNGFIGNEGAVPSDHATFIHSLAAEGYETVLCGRMHFLGADQRHGFTKRLAGDITPTYQGRFGKADWGIYQRTNNDKYFDVVGGGDSPVLAYDRAVVAAAVDYLSRDHAKPQCVVVGTYGPHSTYVAPPELYTEYLDKVPLPIAADHTVDYDMHIHAKRQYDLPDDFVRKVRAAYYGMITCIDSQLGEVRAAWDAYLARHNRKGVFAYTTDHGDQIGERRLYNKVTLFEGSARIPLIFAGEGIRKGARIKQPASLLDVAPTFCELAGAEAPPEVDGVSLVPALCHGSEDPERAVISESRTIDFEPLRLGRMLRKGKWKYILYDGLEAYDLLFNIEEDPFELHNCLHEQPAVAALMRKTLTDGWDTEAVLDKVRRKQRHTKLLSRWGQAVDIDEPERFTPPEESLQPPVIV